MSKRVKNESKTYQKLVFDTIFWRLRSGVRGVQIRVKTSQKMVRVKKCWYAPACQKSKSSFSCKVFVSKRVKNIWFVSKNIFFDTRFPPPTAKKDPKPKHIPSKMNHVSQSRVSKNGWSEQNHNIYMVFERVSKRVKTSQNVSLGRVSKNNAACQKSVKNVSTKCQKRVKNVSKRAKTCQKMIQTLAILSFACQNVSKKTCFDTFLTFFWHSFLPSRAGTGRRGQ